MQVVTCLYCSTRINLRVSPTHISLLRKHLRGALSEIEDTEPGPRLFQRWQRTARPGPGVTGGFGGTSVLTAERGVLSDGSSQYDNYPAGIPAPVWSYADALGHVRD